MINVVWLRSLICFYKYSKGKRLNNLTHATISDDKKRILKIGIEKLWVRLFL